MATFQKRGSTWRAIVRKNGVYASDSFRTKASAQLWAAEKELEIAAARRGEVPKGKTFGDLIDRELEGDIDKARRLRLARTRTMPIADVVLTDLDKTHVAAWRDKRLESVTSASVRREWNDLSGLCTRAVKDLGWLKHNPFHAATRPPDALPRQRRPTQDELDRIWLALGYSAGVPCETLTAQVGAAAAFAIETAMRAAEILRVRPDHITGRVLHIPKTKNGHPRDVPLSPAAQAILKQLPGGYFSLTEATLDRLWRKGCEKGAVVDLHFHDLRREALTRLSKKLQPMELARVSGHRDLRILLAVYYAPTVEDLADKL